MFNKKRINHFRKLENTMINVDLINSSSELLFLEEVDDEGNLYAKKYWDGVEQIYYVSYDSIVSLQSTKVNYGEFKERNNRSSNI